MSRYKPHKKIINEMKERYFSSRSDARRKALTKEQEVELCYLQNEIESRWFRFFADHYIDHTVNEYCRIIDEAPLRKRAQN